MQHRTRVPLSTALIIVPIITFLLLQVSARSDSQPPAQGSVDVTEVAVARDPSVLLPDRLGSVKATAEPIRYGNDQLSRIAGEGAEAYREYHVSAACSRQYGAARVDVFQTDGLASAYGLFTYNASATVK